MKFLKYFVLLIVSAIWIISLSPALTSKMIAADSYRFGDLYRLSNLSQFKDPQHKCAEYKPQKRSHSSKKIHLFIIGDSFTEKERVSKNDFAADVYTYVHWSQVLHVKPDTSYLNILLLECVERHFREKFANPVRNLVPDQQTFIEPYAKKPVMQELDEAFDAKLNKGRLDEMLFQNDLMLGLKQLKADFNYAVFNRVNKEVTPVNQGQNIVYYMDTDTPKTTSSFSKVRKTEIDSIVMNLNESKELALKAGFNEVFVSIVPNKVSVLMPEYDKYNHLIDRIHSHPNLSVPYINVYPEFRKLGVKSYMKGDSHWTCEGQYLWLDKVNEKLIQLSKQ